MDEEPELYIVNMGDSAAAAEYRRERERARKVARQRYHDYLTAAFDLHGAADAATLADVALDTLTVWQDVETGEPCRCSCHPGLPESDLHDFGFRCSCLRTGEDRRRTWAKWRSDNDAFWKSPEGQEIIAAERVAEAELVTWLAAQEGVAVRSHGGMAPEQWRGKVDGHSFYFRERHDEWRIELDLRPSGRVVDAVVGTDPQGKPRTERRELDEGDVIAEGTTRADGYGTSPVGRAQFIVDTIRNHLARQACTLHSEDLSSLQALLGREVRWCPGCGARLVQP